MRPGQPRRVIGIALIGIAVALLAAGIGAALANADASPPTPSSAAASTGDAVGGISLSTTLDVSVLGLEVNRRVDADPPAARSIDLPGLSAKRDVGTPESAALPVDANLGVSLVAGSHLARSSDSDGSVSTAATTSAPVAPASALTVAAAAAAGLGLLALAWGSLKSLGHKLLLVPAIGLYAKISRSEVFENEVRERIFETIRARPGIAATDLARAANVAWGTTIYHLDVLEQTRMVTSVREGRHRRYFLNGQPLEASKKAIAILHNPVTADIAERVARAPGITQKELSLQTGMSPQALHWHLTRLANAGMLRKERAGRAVNLFAAPAA